jgi:hypothetical protein
MQKGKKVSAGGSKNNAANRIKARRMHYQGVEVKPVKYIGLDGSYMALMNIKDEEMICDSAGAPLSFALARVIEDQ